jgi:hypothetical protein
MMVYSATISLYVGETGRLDAPNAVSDNGYIDNAVVLESDRNLYVDTSDPIDVKVTVVGYFSYTATVKIRYVEKYTYNGHIDKKVDHDIEYKITTKYPTIKAVDNNITISVGERRKLEYTVTPAGLLPPPMNWGTIDYYGYSLGYINMESDDHDCYVTGKKAGKAVVAALPYGVQTMGFVYIITVVNSQKAKLTLSASPSGGQVTPGATVTLTAKANGSTVSGCDIYFTTNGSNPSRSNGTKYSSGITISSDCTLKAIAYKDGYEDSDVLTATYTIMEDPKPKLTLSASPSGGEVNAGTKVYLNTTNATGADIYYTLNGTTPTKSSTKYTSSGITINESCTLKAIAYKDGYETSDVLSVSYSIKQNPNEELYYYVGSKNGWDIADKSYPFTKLSDGKTWELTMTTGSLDEFKISIGLTNEWDGNVFGIPFDSDATLKKGKMVFDFNGSNNFYIAEESSMYSYTIRIVPSEMSYEIVVNRNTQDGWEELGMGTFLYVTGGNTRKYYLYKNRNNDRQYKIQGWCNLDFGFDIGFNTESINYSFTMDPSGVIEVDNQNTGCYSSTYKEYIWIRDISGSHCDSSEKTFTFNIQYYLPQIGAYEKMKELFILDKKVINQHSVSIPSAGYATFYSSKSAYTLPNGLSAKVVTGASNNKLTYKTIADGSVSGVIPKGVAVMLVSDAKQAGTCTLTPSESTATYSGTNLLHGSDEATTTKGDGLHYKLSYGPSGTQWNDVFGWYWGAQNGAPFQIEGHKAWLVVPRGNGTRAAGFTIEGEVLGVDSLEEDIPSDIYFDLQGRRISEPAKKGFYIKNGKKIVLK